MLSMGGGERVKKCNTNAVAKFSYFCSQTPTDSNPCGFLGAGESVICILRTQWIAIHWRLGGEWGGTLLFMGVGGPDYCAFFFVAGDVSLYIIKMTIVCYGDNCCAF